MNLFHWAGRMTRIKVWYFVLMFFWYICEHYNTQFTSAVFYIENRKMRFSYKVLYQYFVVFPPAWDSFCSENT